MPAGECLDALFEHIDMARGESKRNGHKTFRFDSVVPGLCSVSGEA